uniref:Uncharacterized protein n=1 Tax=Opuntia streptacantha TaxID=393608 RepID=A0A7C8ZIU3_OPUST
MKQNYQYNRGLKHIGSTTLETKRGGGSKHKDFTGMILLPGSFSGRISSPRPHRGPLPKNLMSLAILKSEAATVLRAPLVSTNASCAASASNLFSAVTKGKLVSSATAAAIFTSNPFFVFSPVPTAVPPCAS